MGMPGSDVSDKRIIVTVISLYHSATSVSHFMSTAGSMDQTYGTKGLQLLRVRHATSALCESRILAGHHIVIRSLLDSDKLHGAALFSLELMRGTNIKL